CFVVIRSPLPNPVAWRGRRSGGRSPDETIRTPSPSRGSSAGDRGSRRALHQLDGVQAVLPTQVALAGVRDDPVVGGLKAPTPMTTTVRVHLVAHSATSSVLGKPLVASDGPRHTTLLEQYLGTSVPAS